MTTETLWCRSCDTVKPITEFHVSRRKRNGRQTYCIPCQRDKRRCSHDRVKAAEYAKRYRAENQDAVKEAARAYRRDNQILERLRRGRTRANDAGVTAAKITVEELLVDWQRRGIDPDRCVYTGEPLEEGLAPGSRHSALGIGDTGSRRYQPRALQSRCESAQVAAELAGLPGRPCTGTSWEAQRRRG